MEDKKKTKAQLLRELSAIKEKYKKTHEALRFLRKALETMQLGVTVTDLEGNILYCNPAEAKMHGYHVKELTGENVRKFAPTDLWNPLTKERITAMNRWKREGRRRTRVLTLL